MHPFRRAFRSVAAASFTLVVASLVMADTQATPEDPMMAGRNGWSTEALITVGESVGAYQLPGIPDGIGAFALNDTTVRLTVHHEFGKTAGSSYTLANGTTLTGARISYIDVDRTTRAVCGAGPAYDRVYDRHGNVVTSGTQINEGASATDGFDRFCSGRLVQAGERGFENTIHFANEETFTGFHPHGGSVWALDAINGDLWACPELGRGAWENVTPIDSGNPRLVALLLSSDEAGSPMFLWIGTKTRGSFLERNGLARGRLYAWVADNGAVDPGAFNGQGASLEGRFVRVPNRQRSRAGTPGYDDDGYLDADTLYDYAISLGAFRFSRPEDVHDNPFDGTQVAFASTGRGQLFPADNWGTVYRIDMDLSDTRRPRAEFTILWDSDGIAVPDSGIRSPDNLVWAEDGFIYVQEDRSTSPSSAFGGTTGEEASLWALDPETGDATRIAQIDRTAVPAGQTDGSPADIGNWESSGVLDVTRLFVTQPGEKLLLLDVQAHSISLGSGAQVEGGQLLFARNY
mgnify:CR=1 FL=1